MREFYRRCRHRYTVVSKMTHGFFITINSMILYFKHIIHIDDFPLTGTCLVFNTWVGVLFLGVIPASSIATPLSLNKILFTKCKWCCISSETYYVVFHRKQNNNSSLYSKYRSTKSLFGNWTISRNRGQSCLLEYSCMISWCESHLIYCYLFMSWLECIYYL